MIRREAPIVGTISAHHEAVIETALFWASIGVTPAEAMEALGVTWHCERGPYWDEVQLAISSTWRALYASGLRRAA